MSKGKIERYMRNDFGLGGISNYERPQINRALRLICDFYSPDFGDAERVSMMEFLTRMEKDDRQYRDRVNKLQEESDYLRGAL